MPPPVCERLNCHSVSKEDPFHVFFLEIKQSKNHGVCLYSHYENQAKMRFSFNHDKKSPQKIISNCSNPFVWLQF